MIQNNVTRMLESKKITFKAFELDSEKHSAEETAAILGVAPEMVFKTIVTRRERPGKYVLAVVPGDKEVSLKALAKALNEKKMQVVSQVEAEKATGLLTGGISPLALINRGFQVVLDISAISFGEIHISGGQRGLNIRLSSQDLIRLTNARTAEIVE
jgi:Cys-tRNA(Pro)/Cys-tRNA(Cys) deacylase